MAETIANGHLGLETGEDKTTAKVIENKWIGGETFPAVNEIDANSGYSIAGRPLSYRLGVDDEARESSRC
jgi:hypothetical protein